jgi:hypothetical protein
MPILPLTSHESQAIQWAIDLAVDMIVIPFGFQKDDNKVQDALRQAYANNIIVFAAAGTSAGNAEVVYPARKQEVICIYSTDGGGLPSSSNPTPLRNAAYHFATLGDEVQSIWPLALSDDVSGTRGTSQKRLSGCSVAVSIAAGIAACILEFAMRHAMDEFLYKELRTLQGMQTVLAETMVEERGSLDYIQPWKLFTEHNTDEEILLLMKMPLRRYASQDR